MEYLTFVEELKKHILKNEKWNISEENYKFYPDGYNAESDIEKEFIRNTNVKYNRVESDTLIGDFINLTVTLEGRTDTYCRFSAKELYNEYQEYGWKLLLRSIIIMLIVPYVVCLLLFQGLSLLL